MNMLKLAGVTVAVVALAGCMETTTTASAPMMRTAPASDENACLRVIAAEANNSVRVLSSETSEANNFVVVGVGAQDARWNCLVKNGVVAEAYFAGSEGAL